jgi:tRNA G37 N-methylase Trm5
MPHARAPPPAERVRERLRAAAGDRLANAMPAGYQRLGRVLVLRLPSEYRPYFPVLGDAWQAALPVRTVLVRTGPIAGELRTPGVERIAGDGTETEVVEHGVRWRFDAAAIMFAAGNRSERRRAGALVRPGETVVDLFAGIGSRALWNSCVRADGSTSTRSRTRAARRRSPFGRSARPSRPPAPSPRKSPGPER